MKSLNRVAIACSATLLLAGCAKKDTPAPDTAAAKTPAVAPAPAAPASLALADVAGTWTMTSVPNSKTDTTPTVLTFTATADTTGWFMTLPSGVKVPVHVVAEGDSVVSTSDSYSSVRRKGAKVHVVTTLHMANGGLTGTTVAHYENAKGDSVLTLHTEAVRKQ